MSDVVRHFARACLSINAVAAERGYPPFCAGFGDETPLNSAPYVFDRAGFRAAFGTSAHRLALLDACEQALDDLGRAGIVWTMLLVGGSFLRPGDTPSDIDGLVLYAIDPALPGGIASAMPHFARFHPGAPLDFKFCPADTHPFVLVKRILFFASLFGYERDTQSLQYGTVVIVPDLMDETPRSAPQHV